MDLASTIGFLLAVAFMAVAVVMGGGSMGTFIDVPSIIVTIGGALATVTMMFPLRSMLRLPKVAMRVFLNKVPDQKQLIDMLVSLAETARRDGLLSLERRLPEINNSFVVRGLQMAIDGTDASVVEAVLRTEMEAVNESNKDGKVLFDQIGKMGPAFGMIGTLLGLILMLGNLSDPDALGPGMAVAMITTLYGAVMANVVCIPASEKLNYLNRQQLMAMEIAVRGILCIRDGDSPRVLEQKLGAFTLQQAA
jgi:chemotaxis protein MotA